MARGGVLQGLNRTTLILGVVLLLGGCEAITNSSFFQGFRRVPQKQESTALSEQGLGKLAKGEMLAAQDLFDRALQANPSDPYALLGKAMVFQQTGQLTQARSTYEALLATRPSESERMVVWANAQPQAVREIASVNLALLQSRQVASQMGTVGPNRQAPVMAPNSGTMAPAPAQQAQPAQQAMLPSGRMPQQTNGRMPGGNANPSIVSAAENNVIARFQTLRELRDQGLITPEEFAVRRRVNLGALLPLTNPPPAAGLDRSVPSSAQISQRLTAIGRALEMRAITVRQHSAERTMIIDGLMPAAPRAIANPGAPPEGLLAAADAVRKLERLQESGLITSDEAAKERAAIEKVIRPAPPKAPPQAAKSQAEAKAEASGPGAGVHLASYRSKAAADRGWAQLRRVHSALRGLKEEVKRVNLGPGKGVFYRLIAGPLPNQAAATKLCTQLKRRRQYCEPTIFGG